MHMRAAAASALHHSLNGPKNGLTPKRSRAKLLWVASLDSLIFLHSTGRVHADIKPDNVLVVDDAINSV